LQLVPEASLLTLLIASEFCRLTVQVRQQQGDLGGTFLIHRHQARGI